MASHTIVTLLDDLDGSEAVETVEFALDGASYEIDLNEKNAEKIRKALARYVDQGRRVHKAAMQRKRRGASVRHSKELLLAVRNWARSNGYELSDRGRIPVSVMDAFDASH